MSFYTGTQNEVLYAYSGASTQLNTFTTEDNLMKTYPPVFIPAGFFFNAGSTGKCVKIEAYGRLGTTSAPTFTWSVRLIAAASPPAWSAGGVLLGSTAALTAGTTQTLAPWKLDATLMFKTIATGAASAVTFMGQVTGPLALASPFAGTIPANNTTPTISTVDNSQSYYLYISAACGTNNGANLIQTEMLKVYGEN